MCFHQASMRADAPLPEERNLFKMEVEMPNMEPSNGQTGQ